MNISLFPVLPTDAASGFHQVISRFRAIDSDSSVTVCDLGEDGDVIADLLRHVNAGEIAESAISGGALLGDDGVGTVCTLLSVGNVAGAARFLSSVSVQEVMSWAPEYLSGVIRGGIPAGYLEDLEESLVELRDIYDLAAREGMCMAQIYEG